MNISRTSITSVTLFLTVLLLSTSIKADEGNSISAGSQPELLGFWPTPRMTESMLRRWAIEAGEKYDLRPDQQEAVAKHLIERWTPFLEENRSELQPLINSYMEARLALDPPESDQVAQWAAKLMPIFKKLRTNVEDGEKEVRELLNAQQQIRFDQERMARRVGLQLFESTLKRWSVGKFKQHEWWNPPQGYDRMQKQKPGDPANEGDIARQKGKDATFGPDKNELPARVTDELSAWAKYVADFCDRFDLDRSQRNTADSFLRELTGRARDHAHRYRERIIAVEEMIRNRQKADEEKLNRELAELYGPIDRMFRELDERLNKLPTPGQRNRAEQLEATPAEQNEN